MKNLLNLVQSRTQELNKTSKASFNTNDFLLEILLDKKILREEVINIILTKRLELKGITTEKDLEEVSQEELTKLYKTSKNGLDTSVSDSNNNSSFSYNSKYEDYKLDKSQGYLKITKA